MIDPSSHQTSNVNDTVRTPSLELPFTHMTLSLTRTIRRRLDNRNTKISQPTPAHSTIVRCLSGFFSELKPHVKQGYHPLPIPSLSFLGHVIQERNPTKV